MQISSANILQMLTDRTNVTITNKYKVTYGQNPLANLHLILVHSKGQGHAHFDSQYLANGDR